MATYALDLQKVNLSIGHVTVTGLSREDQSITVQDEEGAEVEFVVGTHGHIVAVRKHSLDRLLITFRVSQGSAVNEQLNLMLQQSRAAGVKSWPVQLKNLLGAEVISSPQGVLRGMPQIGFGTTANAMEWMVEISKPAVTLGAATVA